MTAVVFYNISRRSAAAEILSYPVMSYMMDVCPDADSFFCSCELSALPREFVRSSVVIAQRIAYSIVGYRVSVIRGQLISPVTCRIPERVSISQIRRCHTFIC